MGEDNVITLVVSSEVRVKRTHDEFVVLLDTQTPDSMRGNRNPTAYSYSLGS